MAKKTGIQAHIDELIELAIQNGKPQVDEHITDRICLIIERDKALRDIYDNLNANNKKDVVNNMIGRRVKFKFNKERGAARSPQSSLITSYSLLH